MSDNRVADVMIAFGAGLLAGVAAGILLAPNSGDETRKQIGELAGRLGERTREEADKAKSFVADQAKRVEHAFEEGKQAYKSGSANQS